LGDSQKFLILTPFVNTVDIFYPFLEKGKEKTVQNDFASDCKWYVLNRGRQIEEEKTPTGERG